MVDFSNFNSLVDVALSVFDYHQVKMDFDYSEKISIFALGNGEGGESSPLFLIISQNITI